MELPDRTNLPPAMTIAMRIDMRIDMRKAMALAAIVSLTLMVSFTQSTAHAQAANGFDVQENDSLFTVSANNASLIAIVSRLSEVSGIPITHTDGRDVAITLDIVEASLEQIIEKLSPNSMIVRKPVNGEDIISEVVVLLDDASGGAEISANLPTGEPAEGVVVGVPPDDPTVALDETVQDGSLPNDPNLPNDGTEYQEGTSPDQGGPSDPEQPVVQQ